jgi:flagellar hook-basal body complex protein FliE
MSIKTISGLKSTLQHSNADDWVNRIESGTKSTLKPVGDSAQDINGLDKTFGDFLKDSIGQVNDLQHEANVAMEKLASGESKNLHETLLAVEKADIAFRTMNQVRSKVIDAYKEIMRMQV